MAHRLNGFARGLPLIGHWAATRPPIVPVVRLSGVIGQGSRLRPTLNLESVAQTLARAFAVRNAAAVALVINSPGGAPVQAGLIFKRIRDLATEKDLKVYVFAEDVAASGGYMLALAGDEVFVHEASIVGSIGVVYAGFGFPAALAKLGVERRLYTAGEAKALLDPFSPEKADEVAKLKAMQQDIHAYFKALVRDRRGAKLGEDPERLFNGDVWVGARAVELGLADGIGDIRGVMREKFGPKVRLRLIEAPRRLWFRSSAVLGQHGAGADDLLAAIGERAAWARFGL
ncbi:MAG: S49 family peptidase [Pseudomonadota bacterium]